ncbi:ParB/RepB/Spo0J family partition protein [Dethiobacter alkaliphilus]|uniref:ParB-like partition protein n=1 Tax=Dethiobacter alkaliphilus AHT 1 TaxID=555088 RepID=C0GI82_DETAL|nr:ParB/RepB/Spo0J family partition protein [Dethiobacter alkaliphilus]EEG76930.1 parB-like partition protein [Dethiobacter alkaliphilus AHT 1]
MSKKRLGKGLQALIPEIEDTPLSDAVDVDVAQISVNPYQPRKHFDEEKLAELARSVEQHGILQPLIVRPSDGEYELVAGERRLRAAKKAGLQRVPVVIRPLTDKEMMEIALIENLQRQDLNPLEEAQAYQRLMEEFNYTQEQLAERVGKSRSAVANTLRLTALHPEARNFVANQQLSEGHARAILSLPLEKQPLAARKAVELGLSVRDTERMAGQEPKKKAARKPRAATGGATDSYIADLEDRLRQVCGTAVNVRMSAKGGGKLEIQFYDLDELERVCEILF